MPGSTAPLWIETDNALGAKQGDVDDGFAILLDDYIAGFVNPLFWSIVTFGLRDHLKALDI